MKIEKKGKNIIFQLANTTSISANEIQEKYKEYKENHIIINFEKKNLKPVDFIPFEVLAEKHQNNNKSFVIVGQVNFDEINDNITVVPSLLEAEDLIELEEIERDLES